MNKVEAVFLTRKKKVLITYVTVGYPDVKTTVAAAVSMAEKGVDIIELGVPFSDPLSDGITIQNASHKALLNGVNLKICLETAAEIRHKVSTPLVFMSYLNPIYRYGIKKFCRDCARVGVNGLIIPDLPPEEGRIFAPDVTRNNIALIYLLAPTSTPERITLAAEKSRGFIYLVSEAGVTGARESLPAGLKDFVQRVRKVTGKPLCVGFGISTPEQAARVTKIADGVIIGSKIVETVETDNSLRQLNEFITRTKNSIRLEKIQEANVSVKTTLCNPQ